MVARVESAMLSGTFDELVNRTLAWAPMRLDEQGWSDMAASFARCFGEVEMIRHDSGNRLEKSGEPAMPATFVLMAFKSPDPKSTEPPGYPEGVQGGDQANRVPKPDGVNGDDADDPEDS
jgi:hypothetical protein